MKMTEIEKYHKKNVVIELTNGGFTHGDLEAKNGEISIFFTSYYGYGATAYTGHPLKAREIKSIRINTEVE